MADAVDVDEGHRDENRQAEGDAAQDRCPVAHHGDSWVVRGHAEVVAAATDPEAFSSTVTTRRAIPNNLDGPEHAAYRAVVDRFLTHERVADQEPQCREHAVAIVDALPRDATVETLAAIGVPYAVRSQSTWLGWPRDLEDDLVRWMRDNHAATRSGDRVRTAAVADRFDHIIRALIGVRRGEPATDVTGELMRETVDGRPLTDEDIVSILRNWTAGDLGSLAASVGVIAHFLATRPEIQHEMRASAQVDDRSAVEAAVEEILRIDDPFIANRRVATRDVELGGQNIPAGGRVLLNWTAANRDPQVFGDPDRYDPKGNADANLVFGIGPHRCPGRALSVMELRVITEELLTRTTWIEPATDLPAVRETPPAGGWAQAPVVLR